MIISIKELQTKYRFFPEGIIHAGAHLLEERGSYLNCGAKRILWVEGNPDLADSISGIIDSRRLPDCEEFFTPCLVDDVGGKNVKFHLAENTQTSSLLNFGLHLQESPEIRHNKSIEIQTHRLDCLIESLGLRNINFDFLNVDVQGVELRVVRGLGQYIKQIRWIYTEVNISETYLGCDKLWMLDWYLVFKGFRRRELKFATRNWGDAFYERANSGGIIQGIIPCGKCMIQNLYFILGNFIRPLMGMK